MHMQKSILRKTKERNWQLHVKRELIDNYKVINEIGY